ncbi:methyl-accepting chemotaxis protein, partial [Motilibacter sp. E257]
DDIGRRVHAIQTDSVSAVEAIGDIAAVVARINDYTSTIASAVEEQTAVTGEMNRSVSEAAGGTSLIADGIRDVAETAQSTAHSVTEAQQAAAELARMSADLEHHVAKFHY